MPDKAALPLPGSSSLSLVSMAGVKMATVARKRPMTSALNWASGVVDEEMPRKWLMARRAAPAAPTTRGTRASSKPGMPRVKRKTATSKSSEVGDDFCCACDTKFELELCGLVRLWCGYAARRIQGW